MGDGELQEKEKGRCVVVEEGEKMATPPYLGLAKRSAGLITIT